jgi:hypothetical protein
MFKAALCSEKEKIYKRAFIWFGSHGGEYEDGSLQVYSTV